MQKGALPIVPVNFVMNDLMHSVTVDGIDPVGTANPFLKLVQM
jgi:hypothetical protein